MDYLCVIYKATNRINGKSYIGFTVDFEKRISSHKRASKKSDYFFHKAIRKYGWDVFDWEILYKSNDLDFSQNIMEGYFIKQYNTFGELGYNLSFGGEGNIGNKSRTGQKITEETREKMKNSAKGRIPSIQCQLAAKVARIGKIISSETRAKLSKASTGRKHTQETKNKMRESSKGRKPSEKCMELASVVNLGNTYHLGKSHSEETKRVLSEKSKGNKNATGKRTEEARLKISIATKQAWERRKANIS